MLQDFILILKINYNINNIYQGIAIKTMSSRQNRLKFSGAPDDIKKGLQKIKQAQIQVMKQLRKDDPEGSRNYSLSYSKDSVHQNRHSFGSKIANQSSSLMKQKIEKSERENMQFASKQMKLRQQIISLAQQVRRNKQAAHKAETKMKQYEKGQQRALLKAQQAISNAIASQKKYIQLKGQYDKLIKQRQRQVLQMKRIQAKQIFNLEKNAEGEPQFISKIIKQLKGANDSYSQLLLLVNSHKCFKKQQQSKNSSVSSFSSMNSFNISTFQNQAKLQKHINNIITYLHNFQNYMPIQQGHMANSNNFLTVSFKEDLKNIEDQLNIGSQQKDKKIQQLVNKNQVLDKKVIKLENQIKEKQQEIGLLRNKIKQQTKEIQQYKLKLSKSQEESSTVVKEKRTLFDKYKVNDKGKASENSNDQNNYKQSTYQSENQKVNQTHLQIYQDRLLQLQKQTSQLQQKLKSTQQSQQSLKSELEETKQALSRRPVFQPNTTYAFPKSKQQVRQMLDVINKLQQERKHLLTVEKELSEKIRGDGERYRGDIEELEQELKGLRAEIGQLKVQNANYISMAYAKTNTNNNANNNINSNISNNSSNNSSALNPNNSNPAKTLANQTPNSSSNANINTITVVNPNNSNNNSNPNTKNNNIVTVNNANASVSNSNSNAQTSRANSVIKSHTNTTNTNTFNNPNSELPTNAQANTAQNAINSARNNPQTNVINNNAAYNNINVNSNNMPINNQGYQGQSPLQQMQNQNTIQTPKQAQNQHFTQNANINNINTNNMNMNPSYASSNQNSNAYVNINANPQQTPNMPYSAIAPSSTAQTVKTSIAAPVPKNLAQGQAYGYPQPQSQSHNQIPTQQLHPQPQNQAPGLIQSHNPVPKQGKMNQVKLFRAKTTENQEEILEVDFIYNNGLEAVANKSNQAKDTYSQPYTQQYNTYYNQQSQENLQSDSQVKVSKTRSQNLPAVRGVAEQQSQVVYSQQSYRNQGPLSQQYQPTYQQGQQNQYTVAYPTYQTPRQTYQYLNQAPYNPMLSRSYPQQNVIQYQYPQQTNVQYSQQVIQPQYGYQTSYQTVSYQNQQTYAPYQQQAYRTNYQNVNQNYYIG